MDPNTPGIESVHQVMGLFHDPTSGLSPSALIKAAEKAHLWPELVFLYFKYDEFVSRVSVAKYTYSKNW